MQSYVPIWVHEISNLIDDAARDGKFHYGAHRTPFCLGGDSFVVSLNNLFRVCLFSPKTGMRYSRGPMSVAEEVEGRENDEKRLLRHLMRGYERDVRPVKNASTPVVIQLSITLTQIFDMVQPPIND